MTIFLLWYKIMSCLPNLNSFFFLGTKGAEAHNFLVSLSTTCTYISVCVFGFLVLHQSLLIRCWASKHWWNLKVVCTWALIQRLNGSYIGFWDNVNLTNFQLSCDYERDDQFVLLEDCIEISTGLAILQIKPHWIALS